MMSALVLVWSLLLASPAQAPAAQAPAVLPSPNEATVRAAVQQYYDAQAARDPDRTLTFWSADANPRPGRDAYLAVFGDAAEDIFVVDVRAVEITGANARVRVNATRTRLIMRNGATTTERRTFLNSQLWRKEAAGWKLLRDAPFADEIADDIIAAAPADRPALYEKTGRSDLVQARLAVSQRATMAVTVGGQDYPRAKALFTLALEMARAGGDRHGEANSLHNMAQADYYLHNYPAAIESYEQELEVARAIDDGGAIAAASYGLAAVYYAQGEYTRALDPYRDALAAYEKIDDNSAMGRALVSIGNVQYLQADYDAALASYRRGLTVLIAGGDPSGAAYARKGLARVLAAQGDVAAALDIYGQVLAEARAALLADARLTADVAAAMESIGELYFRVGNTDQARASFEEAKKLDEKDPESGGRVLAALGMTELLAGRFDAAFAAYSDSRTRFDAAKLPDGVARAWVGIGFSQTARGKFDEAMAAYRTAITLFEQQNNNDGVARAWLGLSMAQSGGGDHAAALESAGKVAAIADRLKSDDLAWRAAARAGEALRKLEKLEEARQAFERATTAIERLAADAPTSPEARGELGDSASAWAGLAFTRARQGDAGAALAAMEARRAHIRRVHFAAFQHDIAAGATADERDAEQATVREIVSIRSRISAEAHAARRDPARAARLAQQLSTLLAKRADQQAALYARLPELARWRGLPQPPLEPAAIADLVPSDGLLVAYLVADDELLILTVARGEDGPDVTATTTSFDRRGFADVLAAAMQPAVLQDAAEWRSRAAPLAAALIAPIARRLAGRTRVVFIPDDLLWKVPLEALPGVDRSATVTYATSLATLALARGVAPLPAEHRAAAVLAAPTIADAVRAQMTLLVPSWTAPDAEVSLTAAAAAAAAYGDAATLRSSADASESAARGVAASADVLHLQAPLQVSGAAPLLSSILLASTGEAPAQDGRFEAREWFTTAARARVIVLPDASAWGAAGAGNAMDAIAWAACAGGASTLVLARWPAAAFTDDDAIAAAFHAKIAAGASPLDAWRATVAAARDKPTGQAPPAAWAGLRLVGGGH